MGYIQIRALLSIILERSPVLKPGTIDIKKLPLLSSVKFSDIKVAVQLLTHKIMKHLIYQINSLSSIIYILLSCKYFTLVILGTQNFKN